MRWTRYAVGIDSTKVNWILDADIRVLRFGQPRMVDPFRRTPDRRSASDPTDPQMAEGRGDGRWTGGGDRGRNAARCGDLASFGQHLPALRPSTSGRINGGDAMPGGRSSSCATPTTLSSASSTRTTPSGFWRTMQERMEQFALTLHPGQDASDRVRPLRGGEPQAARRGQTGDVRLPRLHAHLRAHPARRLLAPAEVAARPDARQAARDQGGAPAASHATIPEQGRWLGRVVRRLLCLPCRAHQHRRPEQLPASRGRTLDSGASPPKPEGSHLLAEDAFDPRPVAVAPAHSPSVAARASPSDIRGGSRMP